MDPIFPDSAFFMYYRYVPLLKKSNWRQIVVLKGLIN